MIGRVVAGGVLIAGALWMAGKFDAVSDPAPHPSEYARSVAENSAACAALKERVRDGASTPVEPLGERSLASAMGQVGRTMVVLRAIEAERRRLGCRSGDERRFDAPTALMRPADDYNADGVRFTPGKPMVDPSAGLETR